MSRRRLARVREGQVFAVPFGQRAAAVGVITRCGTGPAILCAFYAGDRAWSRLADVPDGLLDPTRPGYAALINWRPLRTRALPILGQLRDWNPREWPPPPSAPCHGLRHDGRLVLEPDDLLIGDDIGSSAGRSSGSLPRPIPVDRSLEESLATTFSTTGSRTETGRAVRRAA